MAGGPLLLLAPRVTADSVRIWEAAGQLGWRVRRLGSWRAPEELATGGDEVLVYAEPLFAEAVSDQLGLVLLEPPPPWLGTLAERFLKREIRLSTVGRERSRDVPTFVKPAEGKTFEARVYASGADLPPPEVVDDALPVLCSEPVTWELELRCFILDRKVAAMSPYWRNGALAQTASGWPFIDDEASDAMAFVAEVLAAETAMPPAFVLDVGRIAGAGWAVVEGNPCWGAGLYGCEAKDVLPVLRRAIRPLAVLSREDAVWTSPRIRERLAVQGGVEAKNKALESRLKTTVFPEVEFHELSFAACMAWLDNHGIPAEVGEELARQDAGEEPAAILPDLGDEDLLKYVSGDLQGTRLTLHLRKVTAEELLDYINDLTDTHYEIVGEVVRLIPMASSHSLWTRNYFEVPASFFEEAGAECKPREYFEQRGIVFAAGTNATYDGPSETLCVTLTGNEMFKLMSLMYGFRWRRRKPAD